jgi:DedD protein
MHRVRVGPYVRRADADAVVNELRDDDEGLVPRVLDLRPDESAPVTTPSDPLVRWVVQVGSFAEQARADALVTQLRAAGLPAFSERVTSQSGVVHKVRLGPEISRDRAVELAAEVKQAHGLVGFVTTSE